MVNYKGIWYLGFLLLASSLISCSNEDPIGAIIEISCDDGIQNGDETGIDCGGSCSNICPPENALEGMLVTRLVLKANTSYTVTGPFIVRDGALLEIEAGTVIKVAEHSGAYIAVAQGGRLYVWGTSDKPVVITSAAAEPQPGDWGGLVICGQAPTNYGVNARSALADIFYGGTEPHLTSGVIRYLRLEYTGEPFLNSLPFNGITFYGVGAYTTVEHIQSYQSLGNGIEIVGGTINAKGLVSTKSQQHGVVVSGGWNGTGENWYVSEVGESGMVMGNNEYDTAASPLTTFSLTNMSIAGPLQGSALLYTDGGSIAQLNEVYTKQLSYGIAIEGALATEMVNNGNLNIDTITFDVPTNDFQATNYTGTYSFYTEGTTNGAGNKAEKPVWAENWTVGLD